MARILNAADGRWYDELRAVAYYVEKDLERWILQHAESLFPHHFVIPFKKAVSGTTVRKKPDLALVRRDVSAWAVVEVEVEGHGISHVLDQTRVFAEGDYNAPEMAEYAHKRIQKIDQRAVSLRRITNLFAQERPSVLVIADVHASEWQQKLNATGIDYCIFEIYKNAAGHYVYRTFGQYPAVVAQEAQCRPHASVQNLIEVIGTFEFRDVSKEMQVEVTYDEYLTRWVLVKDGGKQYLRFVGPVNPLSPNTTYGLFRDKSNRNFFRKS
jgi:hypothetical protein